MKTIYLGLEKFFEKVVAAVSFVLGNSITFFIVTATIMFWFANIDYKNEPINDIIRDYIHGLSFLTLFVIQKGFNHFSASLYIKLNELLASQKSADNSVIDVETKSEHEVKAIQRDYSALADKEI